MQAALSLFLALLAAHLAGDFVFQRGSMVEGKKKGDIGAYVHHGAVHALLAVLAVLAFAPAYLAQPRLYLLVLAVVSAHLGCDYLKERRLARTALPSWVWFLTDRALHLAALLFLTALAFVDLRAWVGGIYQGFEQRREEFLWLLVVYLATIFGGGYLIRQVLPRQRREEQDLSAEERARREEEKRLGLYIGWLERFLILSAVLAKSPTAVGFIVAAKSIVRFKKVEKDDEFAEYFLLGTFFSLLLALAGGLMLRWLVWGSLDLE